MLPIINNRNNVDLDKKHSSKKQKTLIGLRDYGRQPKDNGHWNTSTISSFGIPQSSKVCATWAHNSGDALCFTRQMCEQLGPPLGQDHHIRGGFLKCNSAGFRIWMRTHILTDIKGPLNYLTLSVSIGMLVGKFMVYVGLQNSISNPIETSSFNY